MTRFARAKGSKASNERTPEESTPWEVMKEQLMQAKKDNEESKNRKEAEEKRIENYENFLKEQKVLKRKATWCDFPEAVQSSNNTSNNNGPGEETVKKSKKKKKNSEQTNTEVNVNSEVNDGIKSKKKKNKAENITDQPTNTENPDIGESSQNTKKNKKKNKKFKKSQENEASSNHQPDNTQNAVEENPQRNDKKVINQKQQTQKKKKDISGKHMRRKEVNDRSFKLIINGKDVELVRYDGFPVMKKDAERIEELKSNMLKKGIPKSEVQRTIKLERRRAEKALARVKRDVCYNCRKGGHVLSDCPELKSIIPGGNEADGVCFKCGSTEHRQFECKVQKDNEFRFATCFICREPGHIARQCPDNPKGLYPNGGGCKLCGDVTHLRKDCPTVTSTATAIKLPTLDSGENIEDFDQQSNNVKPQEMSKKPKKIKF